MRHLTSALEVEERRISCQCSGKCCRDEVLQFEPMASLTKLLRVVITVVQRELN